MKTQYVKLSRMSIRGLLDEAYGLGFFPNVAHGLPMAPSAADQPVADHRAAATLWLTLLGVAQEASGRTPFEEYPIPDGLMAFVDGRRGHYGAGGSDDPTFLAATLTLFEVPSIKRESFIATLRHLAWHWPLLGARILACRILHSGWAYTEIDADGRRRSPMEALIECIDYGDAAEGIQFWRQIRDLVITETGISGYDSTDVLPTVIPFTWMLTNTIQTCLPNAYDPPVAATLVAATPPPVEDEVEEDEDEVEETFECAVCGAEHLDEEDAEMCCCYECPTCGTIHCYEEDADRCCQHRCDYLDRTFDTEGERERARRSCVELVHDYTHQPCAGAWRLVGEGEYSSGGYIGFELEFNGGFSDMHTEGYEQDDFFPVEAPYCGELVGVWTTDVTCGWELAMQPVAGCTFTDSGSPHSSPTSVYADVTSKLDTAADSLRSYLDDNLYDPSGCEYCQDVDYVVAVDNEGAGGHATLTLPSSLGLTNTQTAMLLRPYLLAIMPLWAHRRYAHYAGSGTHIVPGHYSKTCPVATRDGSPGIELRFPDAVTSKDDLLFRYELFSMVIDYALRKVDIITFAEHVTKLRAHRMWKPTGWHLWETSANPFPFVPYTEDEQERHTVHLLTGFLNGLWYNNAYRGFGLDASVLGAIKSRGLTAIVERISKSCADGLLLPDDYAELTTVFDLPAQTAEALVRVCNYRSCKAVVPDAVRRERYAAALRKLRLFGRSLVFGSSN